MSSKRKSSLLPFKRSLSSLREIRRQLASTVYRLKTWYKQYPFANEYGLRENCKVVHYRERCSKSVKRTRLGSDNPAQKWSRSNRANRIANQIDGMARWMWGQTCDQSSFNIRADKRSSWTAQKTSRVWCSYSYAQQDSAIWITENSGNCLPYPWRWLCFKEFDECDNYDVFPRKRNTWEYNFILRASAHDRDRWFLLGLCDLCNRAIIVYGCVQI